MPQVKNSNCVAVFVASPSLSTPPSPPSLGLPRAPTRVAGASPELLPDNSRRPPPLQPRRRPPQSTSATCKYTPEIAIAFSTPWYHPLPVRRRHSPLSTATESLAAVNVISWRREPPHQPCQHVRMRGSQLVPHVHACATSAPNLYLKPSGLSPCEPSHFQVGPTSQSNCFRLKDPSEVILAS